MPLANLTSEVSKLHSRIAVIESENRMRDKIHVEIKQELDELNGKLDKVIEMQNVQRGATLAGRLLGYLISGLIGAAASAASLYQIIANRH